jgi:hypothetical protein
MVAALVLASSLGSDSRAAEIDPIARVQSFVAAREKEDDEASRAFLAPDARVWYEKREGPGVPWRIPGTWTRWDRFFHGKITYDAKSWKESAGAVSAEGVEINDFYRLIERPAQRFRATWWVDRKGRLTGFLFAGLGPVGGASDSDRFDDAKAWIRANRPGELETLLPNGKFDPTGDRPERWRALLVEWRRAAGLKEIPLAAPPPP